MALNIISNFAANVATRNLATTDARVTDSLAKLSSGTRVVSAKDDAASLAIGSRLRAEVAGLKQASVNAGQASSLLQIADGAYSTISDILVRQKALAVQSASGQLSSTERTVLNSEFVALKDEITRISNDTEFNGTALIKGADLNETASQSTLANFGIQDVLFDTTIFNSDDNVYRIEFTAATDTFRLVALDTVSTNAPATATYVLTASQKTAIAALTGTETLDVEIGSTNVTLRLDRNFNEATDILETAVAEIASNAAISVLTATTTFNDTDGGVNATTLTALTTLAAAGVNADGAVYDATTGILRIALIGDSTANEIAFRAITNVTFGGAGSTDLAAGDAVTIQISGETVATVTIDTVTATTGTTQGGFLEVNIGQALLSNNFTANGGSTAFTFQIGTGVTSGTDTVTFNIDKSSTTALGISGNTITDGAAALLAVTAVGTAIDNINTFRANVGASQNRLDFASSNLSASIENAEAARSQLLDLNIASEITTFTSKQVLLQAGVAMLAQANQLPQNLLQLLR